MPSSNSLSIAVICSSNMNRSMEAHAFLSKKGFNVKSFGTGDKVKLPGNAPDRPNVYDFDTTYEEIYNDLLLKDKQYYTQNGLLNMLDRNRRIKAKPERFQLSKDKFDILITCEERVYDQVIECMESRKQEDNQPAHLINIDIQDNHEEATVGSFLIWELVSVLANSDDLDNDIDELLHEFESKFDKTILHTVLFY
ncbi:RNA polymerase II subunit A C-terminal domain phosphatase SSU72 isoform X2 [Phymastichus coffea]|nr:RNA polymerase II subunit A C-terminal domain phosphatase SSU72 isoform X2 [Phymastichus coffea]XP_058790800.1 RNA polymerase II subunit A C-terminal domain phosphatase SSU72 isoform X2 [Phymastichus coffea]XP_058790809.1 RNA polymerase II subunit A C-terminal domain phosphatase SSU72 isoform X2 [Phymastichus coffea]